MDKKEYISPMLLGALTIAFILGSSIISYPAKGAKQDAWIAHIVGWILGGFLLLMYVLISKLNSDKTLFEVLKSHFGKFLGTAVGLLYIFYFMHIASLVLRSFSEYMMSVNFVNYDIHLIIIPITIVIAYGLKHGFEVVARVTSIMIPIIFLMLATVIFLSIPHYDINNILPILENGIKPVVSTGLDIMAFPFGETVALLVVFPLLRKKEKLLKTVLVSWFIVGTFILVGLFFITLALGPSMITRHLFENYTVVAILPFGAWEPIVSISILITVGTQAVVLLYCSVMGIKQLTGVKNYKLLILPTVSILIPLAIWIHESYPDMFTWGAKNFLPYSVPFQIVIPFILLIISAIKSKKNNNKYE